MAKQGVYYPPGSGIPASQLPGQGTSGGLTPSNVPVNTAIPVVSGTAQVGQTLTTTNGTWTNTPTSYTYQWNRAGTPIGGATASTYVPITADIGSTLTASVVAINGSGSSSPATSAPTSAVTAAGGVLDFSAGAAGVNTALIAAIAA